MDGFDCGWFASSAGKDRRALYLINIVGGAYAITIVPAMVVVQDDLAATAHNLQTHELLYRSGLAAHLLVTTTNVFFGGDLL